MSDAPCAACGHPPDQHRAQWGGMCGARGCFCPGGGAAPVVAFDTAQPCPTCGDAYRATLAMSQRTDGGVGLDLRTRYTCRCGIHDEYGVRVTAAP